MLRPRDWQLLLREPPGWCLVGGPLWRTRGVPIAPRPTVGYVPPVNFVTTDLPGVLVIEPQVHQDDRGFFFETYHAGKYAEGGVPLPFVQDNHSKSLKGTLRGLHAQWRKPQGKLVRCLDGAIWDVAVDMRKGSPTRAQWFGVELTSKNFKQIYVPPGFLHAFVVLSDTAEVEYKCTDLYDPGGELGVAWNDPEIGIEWPVDEPLLSGKDAQAPNLADVPSEMLPDYPG
ncbi:MAG: dTDP-4-dehydrorhamnose 3,5-epimerase [Pseudohongiellaceae bacterium]|jgi:dTDP-4-dehydrorhamnose 3,5-epimerase